MTECSCSKPLGIPQIIFRQNSDVRMKTGCWSQKWTRRRVCEKDCFSKIMKILPEAIKSTQKFNWNQNNPHLCEQNVFAIPSSKSSRVPDFDTKWIQKVTQKRAPDEKWNSFKVSGRHLVFLSLSWRPRCQQGVPRVPTRVPGQPTREHETEASGLRKSKHT